MYLPAGEQALGHGIACNVLAALKVACWLPVTAQAWARKFGAQRILHEIECNERQGTDSEWASQRQRS